MKKKIKVFILSEILFGVLGNYVFILLFHIVSLIKEGAELDIDFAPYQTWIILHTNLANNYFLRYLLLANILIMLMPLYLVFSDHKGQILKTGMLTITDKISIPVPAGNGEYGKAHFMNYKELDEMEEVSCYKFYSGRKNQKLPSKGGFVIGIRAIGQMPSKKKREDILYISKDRHVLVVGATRCGKTRRNIIESIWITILAGENMVITDPKGELWAYTHLFAKEHGYQVMTVDFRNPEKGNHYNYLQEIIDAYKERDVAEAIDLTWDLVSVLVGEVKGEPIWHNGECATIAAAILIVAIEAPDEYKNLTNVYYFLANMTKPDEFGEMPFSRYLEGLPETHPARGVFAMAEIAHVKTRGSFFSSALGTLKYFTNPKIAEMTSETDIKFSDMVHNKTIIYIILPDEKTTLYGLGSMFIMQHYIYLVKVTNRNGGRCPIDWWYFLDEFGNLPYIPPMPQYLSVGAGRGMRFVLVLQDFQMLQKKYKDDYNTIKNNCDCWIYLKGSEEDTLKKFSGRLGNYTIQLNSTNFSEAEKNSKGSHGASLTGRNLLLPEEVGLIENPYSLISFAGKPPLMLIAPDLSFYDMNRQLGLGDVDHNRKVMIERNKEREGRRISELRLWGIWNDYKVMDEYDDYSEDTTSFVSENKISFL